MTNGLAQDQVRRFAQPDLGPDCLQKKSADVTLMLEQRRAHIGLPGML